MDFWVHHRFTIGFKNKCHLCLGSYNKTVEHGSKGIVSGSRYVAGQQGNREDGASCAGRGGSRARQQGRGARHGRTATRAGQHGKAAKQGSRAGQGNGQRNRAAGKEQVR